MRINHRAFPHPVLSYWSDDLVNCAYQSAITPDVTADSFKLNVRNMLSNDDLKDMIERGDAVYGLHVECRATRFRGLVRTQDPEFNVLIKSGDVDGEVDVCSFVLASRDIKAYRNSKFHPDFRGYSFSVSKGSILAVAHDQSFFADKPLDSLKQVPSIFLIVAAEEGQIDDFDYVPGSSRVVIRLRSDLFQLYNKLRQAQDIRPALTQMVVVPVIVDLISELKQTPDRFDADYGECRWYQALVNRLAATGHAPGSPEFESASPIALSMRLIENPLSEAIVSIDRYLEGEE